MLSLVSTGMADCLQAHVPNQYVTSQLGQLSLVLLESHNGVPALIGQDKGGHVS